MSFEQYRATVHKARLKAAIIFMAIPLYLAFGILDYFFSDEDWQLFVLIRVVSCVLMGIIGFSIAKLPRSADRYITYLGHIVTFLLGSGIGYMSFKTGGLESPYYAGLNWIAIGSLAFWPAKRNEIVITIFTIFSPLLIMTGMRGDDFFSILPILSLTFMGGTVVLSVLINALSMKAYQKEYELREKLENLNKNKDILIHKKSADIANLKQLAKQFSPEVIRAIESQSLSLTQRDRKEVSIIFVDIENSTLRANSIDHESYQQAIDSFFKLAIEKLMQNNITVANFMGDGLMAISNAPYSMQNHSQEALKSCFEILNETQRLQKYLDQMWKSPFRIRIGVSSGYATVGFFPNSKFGVYTAIGDTVNLSSRLCTAADAHSIAMTKEVVLASENLLDDVNVRSAGSLGNLKGFNNNEVQYYIAQPNKFRGPAIEECPLCSSPLLPPKDLGDSVLIKCSSCNYSDLEPIEDYQKRNSSAA